MDEQVQKQYESDISMSRIINAFTLVAICISCLGLFGLAAFSAEQRNKEIGIRKVLGASVSGIVQLLSKDFLQLVLIAFFIAIPISWWAMNKWLQGFEYRVPSAGGCLGLQDCNHNDRFVHRQFAGNPRGHDESGESLRIGISIEV